MMVFDEWRNGVPVAFVITARSKQIDLVPWMRALKEKLVQIRPDWRPTAFVLDDVDNEINFLR
jgi:hypothetical protein